MKCKVISLVLATLIFTGVGCQTGCQHNVNVTPRVVFANTLLSAAEAVDTLSISLKAANEFVVTLKPTEPEYFDSIHPWLVKIAKANDKAIAAIRAAKSGDASADWRGAISNILTEAGKTDPTQFGFKNPDSQAAAKIVMASLLAAFSALGSFKEIK